MFSLTLLLGLSIICHHMIIIVLKCPRIKQAIAVEEYGNNLQYVDKTDAAVFPLWCMLNMHHNGSCSKTCFYSTKPLSAILGRLCVLFHHHTLADKEECLEDFLPVQKQRKGKQRAQNPFSPFSLCNYTDKAWRIGFFFPLWNADWNGVKAKQRDWEERLIVAISSGFLGFLNTALCVTTEK